MQVQNLQVDQSDARSFESS